MKKSLLSIILSVFGIFAPQGSSLAQSGNDFSEYKTISVTKDIPYQT